VHPVTALAVAGRWPGHRRRRAVVVEPGKSQLVGGREVRGCEDVHHAAAFGVSRRRARDLAGEGIFGNYSFCLMRCIATTMNAAMITRPMKHGRLPWMTWDS
jgi:hypothetical protein